MNINVFAETNMLVKFSKSLKVQFNLSYFKSTDLSVDPLVTVCKSTENLKKSIFKKATFQDIHPRKDDLKFFGSHVIKQY